MKEIYTYLYFVHGSKGFGSLLTVKDKGGRSICVASDRYLWPARPNQIRGSEPSQLTRSSARLWHALNHDRSPLRSLFPILTLLDSIQSFHPDLSQLSIQQFVSRTSLFCGLLHLVHQHRPDGTNHRGSEIVARSGQGRSSRRFGTAKRFLVIFSQSALL